MLKSFLSALGLGRREAPKVAPLHQSIDQRADARAKARANFPYEIVVTTGENALLKWEELKTAGRGVPVIVGDDIENVLRPFYPEEYAAVTPVSEQLAAADAIRIPEDLRSDDDEAELGEWPAEVPEPEGFSAALDLGAQIFLPRVYIVLIPTDDPTTVPVHLHWGGFNGCLPAPYHVAALRNWRDRYGAELVALRHDTLELRVARKPATQQEALELAQVHNAYCSEFAEHGETLNMMAAKLMVQDWWQFWWD